MTLDAVTSGDGTSGAGTSGAGTSGAGGGAGSASRTWVFDLPRGRRWAVGPAPAIMGIVNVTPDSFSDGGDFFNRDDAVRHAMSLIADGAEVIDIGGESTRPGARPVSASEQLRRVIPVIEALRAHTDLAISIDTMSPEVGIQALAAGADVINDVNACREPGWNEVLTRWNVPVILMHMRGTPLTMQKEIDYPGGVVSEVRRFFESRVNELKSWGVASSRMILDPGIGFGKLLQHNIDLIRNIEKVRVQNRPMLLGVSRKGFVDKMVGRDREERDRDPATLAVNTLALLGGANILRVHNASYHRDLIRIMAAIYPEFSSPE